MKKYTKIVEKQSFPTCKCDMDRIQLLEMPDGRYSLYDSNNDVEIFPPKKVEIVPDTNAKLYFIRYDSLMVGSKNYMSIYDVQSHAFIFRGYLVDEEFIPNEVILFKSLVDDTKRLFDKSTFRSTKSIHNRPLDDATMLKVSGNKRPVLVTYRGTTGLYHIGEGLNIKMEYSSIELDENRAICSSKNHKKLITATLESENFEDITFDQTNKDIVYFHRDGIIYIYIIDGQLIPITNVVGDKAEFLGKSSWPTDCRGTYRFKIHSQDKCTIIKTYVNGFLNRVNPNATIIGIDRMFDDIEITENAYFPIEKGLKGIIYGKHFVEPQYETIEQFDDVLFICHKSGKCDLRFLTPTPITIIDCVVHEKSPGSIIYETEDELGLITYDKVSSTKVTGNAIRRLLKDYFEVETESGKGLYQKGKFIIKPTTLGIELYNSEEEPTIIHAKIISVPENTEYTELKEYDDRVMTPFRDNKYLRFRDHNHKSATLSYMDETPYERIEFFEDFMVTYDCGITTIKTYSGEVLYVTSSSNRIEIAGTYGYSNKKKAIYAIDGSFFGFQSGKLKKITPTNSKTFAAAYVGTYGIVAVNANDKDTFDKKCESIENLDDEMFERTLENHFRKSPDLQNRYPHLVMKPIQNKD